MELQVSVKAFVQNEDGKYLLVARSPEKYPTASKWDIPGGRIEPGTPLVENLTREIMEETGLVMTSTPRLVGAQDILKHADRHVVRLTYVVSVSGVPRLSEEHTEYVWVTLKEMKAMPELGTRVRALAESGVIS